jgi:hypothetical protein
MDCLKAKVIQQTDCFLSSDDIESIYLDNFDDIFVYGVVNCSLELTDGQSLLDGVSETTSHYRRACSGAFSSLGQLQMFHLLLRGRRPRRPFPYEDTFACSIILVIFKKVVVRSNDLQMIQILLLDEIFIFI